MRTGALNKDSVVFLKDHKMFNSKKPGRLLPLMRILDFNACKTPDMPLLHKPCLLLLIFQFMNVLYIHWVPQLKVRNTISGVNQSRPQNGTLRNLQLRWKWTWEPYTRGEIYISDISLSWPTLITLRIQSRVGTRWALHVVDTWQKLFCRYKWYLDVSYTCTRLRTEESRWTTERRSVSDPGRTGIFNIPHSPSGLKVMATIQRHW